MWAILIRDDSQLVTEESRTSQNWRTGNTTYVVYYFKRSNSRSANIIRATFSCFPSRTLFGSEVTVESLRSYLSAGTACFSGKLLLVMLLLPAKLPPFLQFQTTQTYEERSQGNRRIISHMLAGTHGKAAAGASSALRHLLEPRPQSALRDRYSSRRCLLPFLSGWGSGDARRPP